LNTARIISAGESSTLMPHLATFEAICGSNTMRQLSSGASGSSALIIFSL
jgi:hypothetical protein